MAPDVVEEEVASEGSVVLRCILNRPDHANMLTQGVMDGLRALAPPGHRRRTSAGHRDHRCRATRSARGSTRRRPNGSSPASRPIASSSLPCVTSISSSGRYPNRSSRVNGTARMGGIELALACDLIVASSAARLGDGHPGGIGGGGVSKRLPEAIGARNARWLMYTGELVEAERAYQLGLVQAVYPAARFGADVMELAQRIAGRRMGKLAGADQGAHGARAARVGRAARRDRPIHPAVFRPGRSGRLRRVAGGRAPLSTTSPTEDHETRGERWRSALG